MLILLGAAILVVLAFGAVILFGAPYLPTLSKQIDAGLDLLDLKPDQTLLELGSGDGRVLVAAAKSGLQVVGIELNPILVVVSWLRTWRYRRQVRIIWGNFWRTPWPPADGVFVFLHDRFMPKLDARMQKIEVPLISYAFQIPGKKPAATKDGIFLYKY